MRTLGALEVVAELSSGGMGDVYLARRRGAAGFEKLVAVKTIRRDLALREDLVTMFLDEARLMARLDHPSIAQVHDFGEDGGTFYLAMEYIAGAPLTKLIKKPPIPPAVAARWITEVCRGLHAAHELVDLDGRRLGVVHRDVSPHNLIVTFDGHLKILDFGVALIRKREAGVTQAGMIRGKVAYMAPEQFLGRPVDRRADVYAASVVLYELLSGRRLFPTRLEERSERGKLPPPPSTQATGIPPALDAAVLRGLAWEADARFQDAREMALALEEAIPAASATEVEVVLERELAASRRLHQERLHSILGGRTSPERGPEPRSDEPSLQDVTFESVRPVGVEIAPPEEIAPTLPPAIARPSGARRAAIAAGGLALIVLALSWWAVLDREPRAPSITAPPPPPAPIAAATSSVAPAIETPPEPSRMIAEPEPPPRPQPPARRPPRRVSEPPPAPELPRGFGFVTVGARPYGIVVIDGIDLGVSPLTDHRLSAGEHRIELLHPTTRAVLKSRTIELVDGERLVVKL